MYDEYSIRNVCANLFDLSTDKTDYYFFHVNRMPLTVIMICFILDMDIHGNLTRF